MSPPGLFDEPPTLALEPGALLLRGFAAGHAGALLQAVDTVAAQAPFRHLVTPGGQRMSVAMTNCGPLGWISDRSGYRYGPTDPLTGLSWPALPAVFSQLARAPWTAKRASAAGVTMSACRMTRLSA